MTLKPCVRSLYALTCSLLLMPACASGASDDPAGTPPVLEGTLTNTIRSGGQWRLYFDAAGASVAGANREAIWFKKGSNVWRYNVARRAVDAEASSLTHTSLGEFSSARLAEDGRLALSGPAAGYLWTPKNGWSRLPQPAGDFNGYCPAFDHTGTLWAVNYCQAFEWVDGTWVESQKVPQQNGVYPVGDGWLMWNNFGDATWPKYTWFTRTLDDHTEYPKEFFEYGFAAQLYTVGKNSYGYFQHNLPHKRWEDSVSAILRISKETFETCIEGPSIGLDLASGEAFACVPNAEGTRVTVQTPDGKPLAEMLAPPRLNEKRNFFLRDANGHYWLGHWRFDGTAWAPVMPARAFDLGDDPDPNFAGNFRECVASGRLRFDEVKKNWFDVWPQIPIAVQAYDPKSRTGWLWKKPSNNNGALRWEQFAFADDAAKRFLQSVVSKGRYPAPTPPFQDSAGNWWFASNLRWDGESAHTYDDSYKTCCLEETGHPEIVPSPDGRVWMYDGRRVWKRFDPQGDRFEEAAPYNDFAFNFCGRTFAIVGRPQDDSRDWLSHLGRIYEKKSGIWKELPNPFLGSQSVTRGNTFGQSLPYGYPGALVRQGRMLISCHTGVFEWDAKSGHWAYLLPFSNYWAFFDDQGRRVMVSDNRLSQILVYEGDPLASPIAGGANDPAAKLWPAPPPTPPKSEAMEQDLKRMLQEMNDESWTKRDAATRQMIALSRADPDGVARYLAGLDRTKLPPEVQYRIKMVLADRDPAKKPEPALRDRMSPEDGSFFWRQKVGNSLFERMNRPLVAPFPDGYVIRPGMRYELAKSIFQAAGAKYATAIHNQHYPDLSYQGFLLPDRTMVYLRVENKDATGKIVSVDLGRRGEGNDPKWPWDDKSQNSLPSLELTPLRTTISE